MGSTSEQCYQRLELHEEKGELILAEKPLPRPPADGCIVKTHCAGICHSDLHIWQNKLKISDDVILGLKDLMPDFCYPLVMGHEISGEIHALGENYTGERVVGERVVVYPWLGCNACDMCASHNTNMCPLNTSKSLGIGQDGGYQAYVSVPDVQYAVPVPHDVPSDVACLFGCSALTSFNALSKTRQSIERACKDTGAGKLLIIGAGGLGLWVLQWAKVLLPKETIIYVADVTEDKLELAKKQGASETILWNIGAAEEELVQKTKEVTRGGFDGCVDLVGLAATVNRAFNCAQKRATISVVGLAGGLMTLPIFGLAINAVTVTGTYVGTLRDMHDMMAAYTKHKMEAPPISSVPPTHANAALHQLREGKVHGRIVIDFSSSSTSSSSSSSSTSSSSSSKP